ncbi:MAG: proton-conducting transporter membrane subunit, partial [Halolamina sp.]
MKLTLFFCAGAIHVETHTDYISEMAGIGKRMPATMAAFTIGAAGMAGMPLVAGFVSKFYMLIGAGSVGGGYWLFAAALLVSGVLNVAYFWPVVYTAFFESEDRHDAKPLLEFPRGGERRSYALSDEAASVAADGGEADRERADERDERETDEYEYAVDEHPSDHTVPDAAPRETVTGEHVDRVDHHGDHHDAHTGGPPATGWERRSPFGESTWLMLMPIAVIATGAVVLGVVPDYAVFFDLANAIVEAVTGEVVLE